MLVCRSSEDGLKLENDEIELPENPERKKERKTFSKYHDRNFKIKGKEGSPTCYSFAEGFHGHAGETYGEHTYVQGCHQE